MTDDIVNMLRREYDYFNNDGVGDYELLTFAADEIERLRAELATMRLSLDEVSRERDRWMTQAM